MTQINSAEELKERTLQTKENLKKAAERLALIREKSGFVKEQCSAELTHKLRLAQEKNKLIRQRLINVFAKLEQVMGERGLLMVNRDAQSELIVDQ